MNRFVMIFAVVGAMSLRAEEGNYLSGAVTQAAFNVTNLIDVSIDEAKAILEAQSKSEWKAVEDRMKPRLDEVKKQLKKQQKAFHFGSLSDTTSNVRDLERIMKKELRRIRKTYQARVDELRKLKVAKYGEGACSNWVSSASVPAIAADDFHN